MQIRITIGTRQLGDSLELKTNQLKVNNLLKMRYVV